MSLLLKWGMAFYRGCFSFLNPPACKYHPSCSHYFEQAVQKKGAFRGGLKGIWRICRCHPFSKGGYDPVE